MIGIIHYGMGNITSVYNAFQYVGADILILESPREMVSCDRYVLPGVGAFGQGMSNLRELGFVEGIQKFVIQEKRPLLGICLGMQLLATKGNEFGVHEGLNLIPGKVERLPGDAVRLPHVGWNQTRICQDNSLLPGSPGETFYHYYVHSYHFIPEASEVIFCTCEYGIRFAAGIGKENICAFQFHPEKSQKAGLEILRNFGALPVAKC